MTTREYNQCVDLHSDGVYRFILKNLRDEELARDVVQESFLKLWEKASTVEGSKAKSYLYTTAYHTMIDTIRKEKRYISDEGVSQELFSTRSHYSDLKEIIDEAFETLTDIQKSVLTLRDYEGYSYKEIGDIVKLSDDQVKVYIFRARLAMKKYIGSLETVM
jgi:RNA polymerase sigma factor (sigma-70 family)